MNLIHNNTWGIQDWDVDGNRHVEYTSWLRKFWDEVANCEINELECGCKAVMGVSFYYPALTYDEMEWTIETEEVTEFDGETDDGTKIYIIYDIRKKIYTCPFCGESWEVPYMKERNGVLCIDDHTDKEYWLRNDGKTPN